MEEAEKYLESIIIRINQAKQQLTFMPSDTFRPRSPLLS
jgi:hypothetical protein